MRTALTLVTAFGFFQTVLSRGSNDWSRPCFDGECAWDMPDHTGHSGSLKIWGPRTAISDLTPSSGWVVLDCDPHQFDQVIRLTCVSDGAEGHGCAHLFENGAEHTIVRLPESCSPAPFARVNKVWVAEDQVIPSEHSHKISRRDGVQPQILAVDIDYEWNKVDVAKVGKVKFALLAYTAPGVHTDFEAHDGLLDRHNQGAEFVENALQGLAILFLGPSIVVHVVGLVFRDETQAAEAAAGDIFSYDKGEKEFVVDFGAISGKTGLNQKHVLFSHSLANCTSDTGVNATLEWTPKFEGKLKVGIAGAGELGGSSIFSTFQGYAKLDATLAAELKLHVTLKGKLTTGKINLIPEVPIPPFTFTIPKVITLGTHFALFAEGTLEMGWSIGAQTSIGWEVKGAELLFPWGDSAKEGGLKWKESDIVLKAWPTIMSVSAKASASLSGELRLGMTLFSDSGPSTNVKIGTSVTASAGLEAVMQGYVSTSIAKNFGALTNNLGHDQLGGCSKIEGGLDVYIGADLPFLSFWTDPNWKRSLWNPTYSLYKNCWGIKADRSDDVEEPFSKSNAGSLGSSPKGSSKGSKSTTNKKATASSAGKSKGSSAKSSVKAPSTAKKGTSKTSAKTTSSEKKATTAGKSASKPSKKKKAKRFGYKPDVSPRSSLEFDALPTLQLDCPDSKSGTVVVQGLVDKLREKGQVTSSLLPGSLLTDPVFAYTALSY
ncbi:hypothetical protein ONZ45_g1636 [Pleurotus djamor]|nr:hypothetical protein ONZ45_g1636 [Pleurotus djamor]